MKRKKGVTAELLWHTAQKEKRLLLLILLTVAAAVACSVLPPLFLERIVDGVSSGKTVSWRLAAGYVGLLDLAGIMESARESLLTIFGQRFTHGMRKELGEKLTRLPVSVLTGMEPGEVASRFVGDVDTLETLFTSGIISMLADTCTIVSIFAVLFYKNTGLAVLLLGILPLIGSYTWAVQKKMLSAQLENRAALARIGGQIPETIRCIRMIHVLQKEEYMQKRYGRCIQKGYDAMEKTNLCDAFYSPVILVADALTIALVMCLSASSHPALQRFFGMSVGTAVAVISYISRVFSPIESIGMEIQTIQSAAAGARRIKDFLSLPERGETDEEAGVRALAAAKNGGCACVELKDVTFGYDPEQSVLKEKSLCVPQGGRLTLTGRTGAGKSTVFRLLLGQYQAQSGQVLIFGEEAAKIPDTCKRRLFGCVEQHFYRAPGTVLEQITLSDPEISGRQAREAAKLVGLDETILGLENGYDTPCTPELFSRGQWQLLAVARAVAAGPPVLLLDEITADLDAGTERTVLEALKRASADRTVISISHRLYGEENGQVCLFGQTPVRSFPAGNQTEAPAGQSCRSC